MIHLVWSIIVGFVVGLLARELAPHIPLLHIQTGNLGTFTTIVLGVAGSFMGGFVARLINKPARGANFHPAGCLMSIVGAILLLWIDTLLFH